MRSHHSIALALLLVIGCASLGPSIVKKSAIRQVRKIAIISITAPQRVPYRNGKGQVSGWSEADRAALADLTLQAYSTELKTLGWDVLPPSEVAALPKYQENFSSGASKGPADTHFSPSGLHPVAWEEDTGGNGTLRIDLQNLAIRRIKDLDTRMQEVAEQAGADAAVLIQADYCYEDTASAAGAAVITGAAAIYAVTPKGVEVIKMKRIPRPCRGDHRAVSDTRTILSGGELLYDSGTVQKMFLEVARKAASETVGRIRNAMAD